MGEFWKTTYVAIRILDEVPAEVLAIHTEGTEKSAPYIDWLCDLWEGNPNFEGQMGKEQTSDGGVSLTHPLYWKPWVQQHEVAAMI